MLTYFIHGKALYFTAMTNERFETRKYLFEVRTQSRKMLQFLNHHSSFNYIARIRCEIPHIRLKRCYLTLNIRCQSENKQINTAHTIHYSNECGQPFWCHILLNAPTFILFN